MFEILRKTLPVLILELMPPGHLPLMSKRQAADLEIRSRFGDVAGECSTCEISIFSQSYHRIMPY